MYQGRRWCLLSFLLILIFVMLTGWVAQVQSQEKYPTRGVNIICGLATGAADLATRAMLPYLTKKFGLPVNVVSKPGGNVVIVFQPS